MHIFRTHTCGELRAQQDGTNARLSGWIDRKRDHGNLLFIDLRDNFGTTQVVVDVSSPLFPKIEELSLESVITVTGPVVRRSEETINSGIPTGEVELQIQSIDVQSTADPLPMPVNQDAGYPEDIRLRYRFLDLRREQMHRNILLRSNVIASIRRRMVDAGFIEFQTPILTATSPEGARDFLVPSRTHPGKFYALPQAPQQFKQMLLLSALHLQIKVITNWNLLLFAFPCFV